MTTGIPVADFYIAGFITAMLLVGTYAARQWIVRHLGRARPLPDAPHGDEASAPEGGVLVAYIGNRPVYVREPDEHTWTLGGFALPEAPMQGSHAPEWPKHFHGDKLPRRKGA